MLANSAGEVSDGLTAEQGEAAAAVRSAGATYKLEREGFALGPGSWRLAALRSRGLTAIPRWR
jgi:hypothetical protein